MVGTDITSLQVAPHQPVMHESHPSILKYVHHLILASVYVVNCFILNILETMLAFNLILSNCYFTNYTFPLVN